MDNARVHSEPQTIAGWWYLLAVVMVCATSGCAAFHPIRGVPAPYVPPEYLGPSRSGKKTIDLSLLVQTQPDQYRVAAGDTLSIFIPGVLGSLNVTEEKQIGETPPINLSSNPGDPPTIGYPITVRGDGTIALPYVAPINVHGMTLPQIELAIRDAYTRESHILNGERDRVLVSLQRRREVSVIVVRQETSSELTLGAQPGTLNVGNSKRGTARTVRLPAYENDVLHALASSQPGADGLPGLNAKNTIYIIRRKKQRSQPTGEVAPPVKPAFPHLMPSTDMTPNQAPRLSPPPVPAAPQQQMPLMVPPSAPSVRQVPTVPAAPLATPATLPVTPQPQSLGAGRDTVVPQRATPPVPPPMLTPAADPQSPSQETPVKPGHAPAWPAPAQPASSIQRTSGHSATMTSSSWPQVRGQSPDGWSWGHADRDPLPHAGRMNEVEAYPSSIPQGAYRESIPYRIHQPSGGMAHHGGEWSQPLIHTFDPAISAHGGVGYSDDPRFVGGHDDGWRNVLNGFDPTVDNPNVIKIPIRLAEGERPTFTERDIILEDGDIVFIESRETEVFYTGGLLGGGQYTLPRDYDLRVLEAISIAQSPQSNNQSTGRNIGGVSALNQDVTISASHVIILRSLPNGTRIPIEVDLYKAVRRPQENILIQPGDLVILQYTKIEAIAAFLERHLLEGALFGLATAQWNSGGN